MGREAEAQISFAGQTGACRILLESAELILRGQLRARIPRSAVQGFVAEGDDLLIQTDQGPLCATLGAKESALWVKALAKPAPSLANKLAVSPTTPARVIGTLTDPELIAALQGCTCDQSQLLIAELPSQAAFDAALAAALALPDAILWGVTQKGAASPFPDASLRTQMRAAGFIDSKSCAVSARHSATRYGRRP